MTPAVEAVCVPAHLTPPESWQPKQLHHLHAQPSLGQNCHRPNKQTNKVLHLCTQGRFGPVQLFVALWTVACQASLLGQFARQEYWNVLANTGCHTLLEHCISYYSSRQPLWVPGAARTPATQAAAPPPHLAFTGVNPRPPGQPQKLNPTYRGGNKTTIETRAQCG